MIVNLHSQEPRGDGLTDQRAPSGAHAGGRDLGQLLLERIESTEVSRDCGCQLARGLAAAVLLHVLPEDAVQDVTGQVERERMFDGRDCREVSLAARLFELLELLVGAVDIRFVMFVVVQLHDLARDVGLEGAVVVGKVGEYILRHKKAPASGARNARTPGTSRRLKGGGGYRRTRTRGLTPAISVYCCFGGGGVSVEE